MERPSVAAADLYVKKSRYHRVLRTEGGEETGSAAEMGVAVRLFRVFGGVVDDDVGSGIDGSGDEVDGFRPRPLFSLSTQVADGVPVGMMNHVDVRPLHRFDRVVMAAVKTDQYPHPKAVDVPSGKLPAGREATCQFRTGGVVFAELAEIAVRSDQHLCDVILLAVSFGHADGNVDVQPVGDVFQLLGGRSGNGFGEFQDVFVRRVTDEGEFGEADQPGLLGCGLLGQLREMFEVGGNVSKHASR